jgi:hypothetical protein
MDCSGCGYYCESDEYSNNQWRKGRGSAMCKNCVAVKQQEIQCEDCGRWCDSENSLNMHMKHHIESRKLRCESCDASFDRPHDLEQHRKVHRPKDVQCPICGDKRFASAANAVAHVESGYCSGCLGKDHARSSIYRFVSRNAAGLCAPMIEYGSFGAVNEVPDRPYRCTYCSKTFTMLSAQMNHEGDVHRHDRGMHQLGW